MDILINEMLLLSHFVDVHTYIKTRKLSRLFANVVFFEHSRKKSFSLPQKNLSKNCGRQMEKKLKLNISILGKLLPLGLSKTFKSSLSSLSHSLYSFIKKKKRKKIVVCTSLLLGKALMKLLEFWQKNGSWQ